MANIRVAQRYALAIMGLAEEQKLVERVAQDFEVLKKTAAESREFLVFLKSPVINKEKKKEINGQIFGKTIHAVSLEFLNFLAEKRREDILQQIMEQFFALRNERLGIVTVEVKAAVELVKDQSAEIQKRFEGYTKKKVQISFRLDKQLKGGFIARVGDTVYDGSIKRQLELLRERFAESLPA
ncbi:MAG: F0F1 ATP synthase subunit delta [Bacteroidetes bacterium]|nr:F0F1 ATP synthase subunit delta [Bacteroidota bacterium]